MFVDAQYEVRVICSQCVLSTPARELFGEEGPTPWPKRFYKSLATKSQHEIAHGLALSGAVLVMVSLMVLTFLL
jgi:hypothetical protein